MKSKIYILTYNRAKLLNITLRGLFESDAKPFIDSGDCEVFIINNHSNIHIDGQFKEKVTLLNNVLRPDFSTGHIGRNWNQALILGFESLSTPMSDLVITLQDDVLVQPDWYTKLKKLHFEKNLNFVQNGHGDALCSYTPEAVKKVGLWDERFIFGLQASDYFYRQLMFNWDGCTINDPVHTRSHNPLHQNEMTATTYLVANSFYAETFPDPSFDINIASSIIKEKYHHQSQLHPWTETNKQAAKVDKFKGNSYIFYPYFEKDIYELKEKKYVL